jgi:hypothetical protein
MASFRRVRGCNPLPGLFAWFGKYSTRIIIWSLVSNTALAQLFYNSAGTIVPNSDWRMKYLVFSAVLSMIAFSLFELRVVQQLRDALSSEPEIRKKLPGWVIPGHIATLLVISIYNMYSLFLLNALIWPDLNQVSHGHIQFTTPTNLPELPKPWKYLFHAVMYSLILFLATLVGERKKSAEELAAEEDEHLYQQTITDSTAYYQELIAKGGRNVVHARQVLSTPNVARKQSRLLAALEGRLDEAEIIEEAPPALTSPVRVFSDEDTNDDEAEVSGAPPNGRFNPRRLTKMISAGQTPGHGRDRL